MRALRIAAAIVAWAVIAHLAWPPDYAFPPGAPFRGESWLDPYAGLAPGEGVWLRANLHTHARIAEGVPFPPNSPPLGHVRASYRARGYDLVAISNYMSVTPPGSGDDLYLPAYEHGWGLTRRWHFTVLGSRSVDPLDFPLFQGLVAKQYRIDRLGADGAFVILNHPDLDRAFSRADLRRLTGYHGIELRSRFADAERYWDAALSAGRLVWGFCTDDTRKYTRPRHTGIGYVLVHARERSSQALLDALRAGRFVSVFTPELAEPNALLSQRIEDGRLRVRLREPADRLELVGQGGAVRWSGEAADSLDYEIAPDDGYLRVRATTRGTDLFLQPVVRHEPGADPRQDGPRARVMPTVTALRRGAGLALALVVAWALVGRRRR